MFDQLIQEPNMTSQLAQEVAEVPEHFASSDRSTSCLLKDAGFPELREALTADEIERVLHQKPGLIDLWLQRSKDQRLAGGWGIECDSSNYRIQCYSGDVHVIVQDKFRAVAEFIVRYVRYIGEVQARGRR